MRKLIAKVILRRILPKMNFDPLAVRKLLETAWPEVVAMTATKSLREVPVAEEGSDPAAVINEYATRSEPVIIKGFADAWTFKELQEKCGSYKVPVRVGNYTEILDGGREERPIRLDAFVDYLLGNGNFQYADEVREGLSPYVGNAPVPGPLADSLGLERLSQALGDHTEFKNYMWIGSDSSTSPLHCHQDADVVFCQLTGSRPFSLVPPHEALKLGMFPLNRNIVFAAIDPDLQEPAEPVQTLHCELDAGDALLIPGFWFHGVRLGEPSLGVSAFGKKMPQSIGGELRVEWFRERKKPEGASAGLW